jgi:hypothetical protein
MDDFGLVRNRSSETINNSADQGIELPFVIPETVRLPGL